MRQCSTIKRIFILIIFVLNCFILTIPIQDQDFINSNHILAQCLRGIGFKYSQTNNHVSIPKLGSNSSEIVSNPLTLQYRKSAYYTPGWADTRWSFRKNITINHLKVSSDLVNFPVLVNIYDSDLHNDAQASGSDIMFTDVNGSILDSEIETFNRAYNSTHSHLVAWVESNLSSTQDTIISMYYGNSNANPQTSNAGVWDVNYIGVWHLSEEGSGTTDEYKDSGQYGNDGQGGEGNISYVPSRVQGQIGYGQDFNNFDGYYDLIDCGNDSSLNITGYGITLEAWIQHNITPQDHYYGIMNHKGWIDGYSLWIDQLSLKLAFNLPGESHKLFGTSDVTVNTWHHVVATYDGSYMRVYIDGTLEGSLAKSDAIKGTSQEQDFWIGHGDQPKDKLWSAEWEGQIDEVRVSDIGRSGEWIETQYVNQNDPDIFFSLSSEESYGTDDWAFKVFRFRKNITIDSTMVSADLIEFPVLIELYDSELHSIEKVQSDGDDIIFVDSTNTKLSHEIEFFDQEFNSTHAHLITWVNIPILSSSSDTVITMYYGNNAVPAQSNPEGVWDNNYGAVWHLGDKPSDDTLGGIKDSTLNNNDGTPQNFQDGGGGSTDVTGIIGGAVDFGDDDYISISTPTNIDPANILTLSAWIMVNTSVNGDILSRGDSYAIRKWPDGRILFYIYDGSSWVNMAPEGVDVIGNEFHYIVVGQNSTGMFIYIDGVEIEVNSDTNSISYTLGDTLEIGRHGNGDNGYNFTGIIDEVRISTAYRSAAWIATEWANQHDPMSFYNISNEEINTKWWADKSFNSRRDIVIDHSKVAEDLTNFPILVELTDSSFKLGKVQSDGGDILFVDSNGTKLVHEIESFTQNNTHGSLITWVKLPILSVKKDTIISLYYGNPNISNQENPSEVWQNYQGVWHLSESNGNALDSTSFAVDGTVTGATQGITGQIDGAYDFDGIDDRVQIADPADGHLDFGTESFSFSLWVNIGLTTSYQDVLYKGAREGAVAGYTFYRRSEGSGGTVSIAIGDGTDRIQNDFSFSSDTWIYVVGVADRSTNLLHGYKNGIEQGSGVSISSLDSIDSSRNLLFADGYDNANAFIDEVRISLGALSPGWIVTEFNNQYEPETFYTVGSQISLISDIVIEETVSIGGADVTQLTTPTVAAKENDLYLLSISMKPYLDVSSVTGLGLTWSELEDQPAGRSQTGLSVWYAQGNPIVGGVTAILASQAAGLAISLSRISGVHYTDPFGTTETANTNGIDGLGVDGVDCENANVSFTTSNYGSMIFGIAATRLHTFIPDQGYTQIDVITGSTSGDQARITSFQKAKPIPGYVIVNGTNAVVDWAIAGIEIKPAIIDINPPIIDEFGIYDSGDGNGVFWAKIHDLESSTTSVEAEINGSGYSMINNGSHWIYQITPNFDDYYEYRVFNATDSWGNNLAFPTGITSHTFNIDNLAPTVQDWEYYDDIGTYGTFKANVSDSWGAIGTVIVNVTEGTVPVGDRWAVMALSALGYMNDTIVLSPGSIKFVIIVNDTAGNSFTSTEHQGLVPGANQPPNAENVTLSRSGTAVLLPILSNDTLYLDYDYFDPDSDPEGASEIRWYKNGIHQATYDDQVQIPASALIKGDEWNVTVKPFDGQEFGTLVVSPLITIQNTPPDATSVNITPSSPVTTSTLSVSYSYSDYDGDSQNTGNRQVRWYKDGVLQTTLNDSLSVASGLTNKGEEWYYTLRVHDGTNYSGWITSTSVTIANSAPSATSVEITPANPLTGNTLNASYYFSDVDGDSESGSLIRWYKNGVLQTGLNDSITVDSSLTLKGENWYFTIEASDGVAYGTLKQGATVIIGNTAPIASNLDLSPSNPVTGNDLTADYDFFDADSDPESGTQIIWYKDGVLQGGLNGSTDVQSGNTTKGQEWHFKVRPSDGTDDGVWYSCPLNVTIVNTAPTVSNLVINPSSPDSTDDLSVSYDYFDTDFDPESSYEILWFMNGSIQDQLNDSILVQSGNLTKGQIWHVKVQVYDGSTYSSWYDLTTNVTISNSPPSVSDIRINGNNAPTQVADDQDLIGTYDYYDADNDAQVNTSREIFWYKKSQAESSFYLQGSLNHSLIVGNGSTTFGDTWYFIMRVYDGTNYSIFVSSPSVSIGVPPNSPPEAQFLNITPSLPITTDALFINWTFVDSDTGDNESGSLYYWYRNGIHMPEFDGLQTLPAFATAKGEIWHVKVRPRDGVDFGQLKSVSLNVTISNSAPEANSLQISPNNPITGNDLGVNYIFVDIDGDGEAGSEIIWFLNGVLQGSLNGSFVVLANNTSKGQEWHFKLRPKDGTDFGSWLSCSSNITIGNTAPSASSLAITPVNPKTGENLIINYSFSDPDSGVGDTEGTSLIRWFKNGLEQTGYENQTTIPFSLTQKGENWWFEVTPFDGTDYGLKKTSPLITIMNTAPTASNLQFNPTNPITGIDLTLTYSYSDVDNEVEGGTIILWYKNGVLEPTYNDMATVEGAVLVKDDVWNVSIRVSDGSEFSSWLNGSITIVNTPPTVVSDSAEIFEPASGLITTSSLFALWSSSDADGDAITDYKITWENRSGGSFVEQAILENLTEVTAMYTQKNQEWRFKIQIFDGEAWSVVENSFVSTILNSEPLVGNITLSGGQTTTDPISVTYDFYDADGDPDQSEILWGIYHLTPPFIFILGNHILPSSTFTAGDLIWVEITPDDNDATTGQGEPVDTSRLSGAGKQIQVGDTPPQINTTLGMPTVLADHPDGSNLFTASYSLFVNYSALVYDIDSGESSSLFDINLLNNGDIQYYNIDYVIGAQYRWYKFNSGTGLFELQPSLTKMVVDSYYLQRDDEWIASVRPCDNYGYYGDWVNTTSIIIGNSYPQVLGFQWSSAYPSTTTDLSFSFDYFDYDGDPMIESQNLILWYKNGILIFDRINNSLLESTYFVKSDNISVIIRPFDGTDWAGKNYSSIEFVGSLMIINTPPVALNVTLVPMSPDTVETLNLSWIFSDADNDSDSSIYMIEWTRSGVVIPELENLTVVPSSYTSKSETWKARVWVFDGVDYSYIGYASNNGEVIVIQNSPMVISEITFSGIDSVTIANNSLLIEWNVTDPDNDGQVDYEIFWYCDQGNGTFLYRSEYNSHIQNILANDLFKGQSWYCIVRVYDGDDWSSNMTSPVISIINAAPEVSNLHFVFDKLASQVEPDIRVDEFYVEDENIVISYSYFDIDNDSTQTRVEWFKITNSTILEMITFDNSSIIPASAISVGEQWYCTITAYDGFLAGQSYNSSIISILSRPVCTSYTVVPDVTSEGNFIIEVTVSDESFDIYEVQLIITFNDSSEKILPTSNSGEENWTTMFILEDLTYLNTNLSIIVKASTIELNSGFEIFSLFSFDIQLEDKAPPRVIDAFFEPDSKVNPNNLTFIAYIEEFGAGISEVVLFYYFNPVDEESGNGASLNSMMVNQVFMSLIEYNSTGNYYIFDVNVKFVHNNTNTDIIYWISTTDNAGNTDPLAFDIRDNSQRIREQRFIYTPPGLPEWVLLVAGLVICAIFVGAVVYVKFIRKPELVGLDKELVIQGISQISEVDVNESLDEHTLGMVISFFDQRHGPIPIIVVPEILKDNFTKLVELSDRSFSGTGFSDNYEIEIPSSYDFVLDHGIRTSVLSFGFALEKPEARGGQENLTLNVLVHQDMFPLIQSFQKTVQQKVHEIHMDMAEDSTEKASIRQALFDLRKYVSYIILSYKNIYGTTELLEEDGN